MQPDTRISDFEGKVARALSGHTLLQPGDRIIVAVSGGADSIALLSALLRLGFDCIAAHCNFHLRGAESQRDMNHVRDICSRLGVDLMVRDFDVKSHRQRTGESIEMACRTLRYAWFDDLLTRERARAIAVGHHREDNIETLLLNLFRSTGIEGLRGIRFRRGYIVRPLLDLSRAEIEEYLSDLGLTFINDSSNSSDAHLRNRLRNHVIPTILRYFPDADKAVLTTAANIDSTARLFRRAIDEYRTRYTLDDGRIDLASITADFKDDAPTLVRELLKDLGITSSQCADIVAATSRSGLRFPTQSCAVVELDRGLISIVSPQGLKCRQNPADPIAVDLRRDVLIPVNLRISRHHVSEFAPLRDPAILYLDASALDSAKPWAIRHWHEGDRMRPFGLRGSRLVSDIFSDAKYSAADKRNAWLLTCGEDIVWIIGLRPSAHFNIGPQTRDYLKIHYKK